MTQVYDAIVVGVGGFGSATACELTARGLRVLGLEQFDLCHDRGSSHGETRIIRRAYFEHPDYVPLLDETYQRWEDLQQATGRSLLHRTGLVLSGPRDGEAVPGVLLARSLHHVKIEELDLRSATEMFPGLRFPPDTTILFEPDAGYLRVDECVRTFCDESRRYGATLHSGERVEGWSALPGSVRVRTAAADYEAKALVLTAGAWSPQLMPWLQPRLQVLRKTVFWFRIERNVPASLVFYFESADGRSFYGLPGLQSGTVKVGEHSGGRTVEDPSSVDRRLSADDTAAVSEFVASTLRGVAPQPLRGSVCLYSMSPDGHFFVDQHPDHANVILAAGFSGHGFKFTPVIAAAIADLVTDGRTSLPIAFLGLSR